MAKNKQQKKKTKKQIQKIQKKRMTIGVILNLIIFVITTLAILWQVFIRGKDGPLGEFGSGLGSLQTFTNDSNILIAVIALCLAIAGICYLSCKKYEFSHFWRSLQLIGTTAVLLTFTVVAVFLAPLYAQETGDPLALFKESMIVTHLLTPMLAIIVFIFFTPSQTKLKTQDGLIALMPVLVYGIFYVKNVVLSKTWPDFYNFTFGGQTPIIILVVAVIFAVTFGLSELLIYLSNKYQKML